jgi:hypothetical protein
MGFNSDQAVVGSGLSALFQWTLVESFSLFWLRDGLNLAVVSFPLGNSIININNNTGPLLEIMLADEHLRTSITHINLF